MKRTLLTTIIGLTLAATGAGGAVAAGAKAGCDFDGNGKDDLAIGSPGETVNGKAGAGMVNVQFSNASLFEGFGGSSGILATGIEYTQATGGLGAVEAGDEFGAALTCGDFNDDGFDDLAIGAPGENIEGSGGTKTDAGAVFVLYGNQYTGLVATYTKAFHQNAAGIEGVAESGDRFGEVLAAGDFNGDGNDDLAIGAPSEVVSGTEARGAVHVLYGFWDTGLSASGDQLFHGGQQGMGFIEGSGWYGHALATGSFDGDAYDDLAIGAPGAEIGNDGGAGGVHVLPGSPLDKLTVQGSRWLHQDYDGIEGAAEPGDFFGKAVGAGDFDGDGKDDLAIGVPFEGWSQGGTNLGDPGVTAVVYGSPSGPDPDRSQTWHQGTPGVLGEPEWGLPGGLVEACTVEGDWLGYALAVADFDGDGRDDLAMGAPTEKVGSNDTQAGAVNVLYGSQGTGLTATADQILHQGKDGSLADPEPYDHFGVALAAGDYNGDGKVDLAVASPQDSVGGVANAGQVEVFLGWNGPGFAGGFFHGLVAGLEILHQGDAGYDLGDTPQATDYVVDPPWCALATVGEQFGFGLAG